VRRNAIAHFPQSEGNKVIFSTHQSSPQIANAQQNPNDFACVLDDSKIRVPK
jgi:predicted helicase